MQTANEFTGYQFVYSAIHQPYRSRLLSLAYSFSFRWEMSSILSQSRVKETHLRARQECVSLDYGSLLKSVFSHSISFFGERLRNIWASNAGAAMAFEAKTKDEARNKRVLIDKVISAAHNVRWTGLKWLEIRLFVSH